MIHLLLGGMLDPSYIIFTKEKETKKANFQKSTFPVSDIWEIVFLVLGPIDFARGGGEGKEGIICSFGR